MWWRCAPLFLSNSSSQRIVQDATWKDVMSEASKASAISAMPIPNVMITNAMLCRPTASVSRIKKMIGTDATSAPTTAPIPRRILATDRTNVISMQISQCLLSIIHPLSRAGKSRSSFNTMKFVPNIATRETIRP